MSVSHALVIVIEQLSGIGGVFVAEDNVPSVPVVVSMVVVCDSHPAEFELDSAQCREESKAVSVVYTKRRARNKQRIILRCIYYSFGKSRFISQFKPCLSVK
jgi:hypothetical protein